MIKLRKDQIEDIYVLSPAQQGILFQTIAHAGPAMYLEQWTCLADDLEPSVFKRAWQTVVERHPALRTGFHWQGLSHPVQLVSRRAAIPFVEKDWSGLSPDEIERSWEELLKADRRAGCNLEEPPLLRVICARIANSRHRVLWSIHHLIHDAWSIHLLLKEVQQCYAAIQEGREAVLEPVRPYRDYIAWLAQSAPRNAERFWSEYLRSLPGRSRLAADYSGSAVFDQISVDLPPEMTSGLSQLARAARVTQAAVLHGLWALVLYSEWREEDVVFASTFSGRPAELRGVDSVVGLFVNTLPVRLTITPDLRVYELFQSVRVLLAKLAEYEHIPLNTILGWCGAAGSRIFDSLLIVLSAAIETPRSRFGDVKLRNLRMIADSNFPLAVTVCLGNHAVIEALYDRGILGEQRVRALVSKLQYYLADVLANPHTTAATLCNRPVESQMTNERTDRQAPAPARPSIRSIRPRAVVVSGTELVRMRPLLPDRAFPLLVEPAASQVRLMEWAPAQRELLDSRLRQCGALLFRGFALDDIADFQLLMHAMYPSLLEYKERSTPRTELTDRIYTSTEYPSHQQIAYHNEFSYALAWPMRISFYCVLPPASGGETPLSDSRKVYQTIRPELRRRFEEKGVMYVRRYGTGIDLSWQEAYQTEDRSTVEAYCRDARVDFEWTPEDLRTRQVRPAVSEHPVTKEVVWFNQAHLFHTSNLEPAARDSMRRAFAEPDLPRNAYFGDGTPISDEELDEVRDAYRRHEVAFPWQKDDLLILDNMLIAHGRMPYEGARKIVVAMAEPYSTKEPVAAA